MKNQLFKKITFLFMLFVMLSFIASAQTDTDIDGVYDEFEIAAGSNPLDATSLPKEKSITPVGVVASSVGFGAVAERTLTENSLLAPEAGTGGLFRFRKHLATATAADMWLSSNASFPHTLTYDLGANGETIDGIYLWQYNQSNYGGHAAGVKEFSLEYATVTDPTNFVKIGDYILDQADGITAFASQAKSFTKVENVRYVKIVMTSNYYDGVSNLTGLSKVRFQDGKTQVDQSITFDALAEKEYGDASFELTATASSGLPVTYVSSDNSVATINDNQVTIVGAGTVTITASQDGNGTYLAAPDVSQQLVVSKRTLMIRPNGDKDFGEADPVIGYIIFPPLTLVPGDTFSGTFTRSQGEDVGNYLISQGTFTAGPNYELIVLPHFFTIFKADQNITFDALDPVNVGDADFNLSASSDSGLDIAYASSDETVAIIVNGDVVTIVGEGTTTITASQAGNDSYNEATPVEQILTVNAQTLSTETVSTDGVTIYPNPATDFINIKGVRHLKQVNIFSVDGQLVKSVATNFSRINVSFLNSGFYILQVNDEAKSKMIKFIKD